MQQKFLWLGIPWILIAVFVFAFDYPAAMDIPNHMARAHILNTCIADPAAAMCQNFLAEFRPISYFFPDYTLMLLLKVFPSPFVAGKIALFIMLSINLLGWFYLFKRVHGHFNAVYIAGLLLLLNNFFYKGFYAYILGNGALFFWLAFWWPRRDSHTFRTALSLSFGLALLYLCHLAAFFGAIICYGAYGLWCLLRADSSSRISVVRNYFADWFFWVTFVAIYGFQQYATSGALLGHVGMQGLRQGSSLFSWLSLKALRFSYVTYNHSKYFDSLIFAAVLLFLIILIRRNFLKDTASRFWLFCSGFFILAYVVTPDISHGGADVDLRFLLPAYYLIFLGFGSLVVDTRFSRVVITALVAIQFGFNFSFQFPMQEELGRLSRALDTVPPGKRLVEVNSRFNFPTGTNSRVNPLSHFATYYMVQGGSMVGGLLNCYMNPNIPYFCYRNAADSTSTFKFQFQGLPALEDQEINSLQQRFDYILVIEPSAELVEQRLPQSQFQRVFHEGDVYVLRTIAAIS